MAVRILYFAAVRDCIGMEGEVLDLPEAFATPSALADWLAARSDGHATAFADRARLRCAVDQVMVPLDGQLGSPQEVAFFPPVTGG